jgi:hypothetical protein
MHGDERNMYDVIAIGNDTSTFIAATRTAQLGYKTIILSDSPLSDKIQLGDYFFDIDPIPFPQFRIMNGIHFLQSIANQVARPANSKFQVILSDNRIDSVEGKYNQIAELSREIPDKSPQITKVVNCLDEINSTLELLIPELCNSNRSGCLKLLPKIIKDRFIWMIQKNKLNSDYVLKSFFESQMGIFSNYCSRDLPSESAYLLSQGWQEASNVHLDKSRFFEEISKQFIEYGGFINKRFSVHKIFSGNQIEVFMNNNDSENRISGRTLILSTKWCGRHMNKLDLDQNISKWLNRYTKHDKISHPFTIHLGVHERAIPEKMAQYVIMNLQQLNSSKKRNAGLIFINSNAPGDLNYAPADKRSLSASVFLDRSPIEMEDSFLQQHAETTLDHVCQFLPFLRGNIDMLDIEKSIEISREYQDKIMWKNDAFKRGLLSFSIFPDLMPKRNIIMTGGEFFAGFGYAGEILSGIHAANRISGGQSNG